MRPKTLDRPIAWVCEAYRDKNDKTQIRVVREGMTREEIIEAFPRGRGPGEHEYNRAELCRAIIYEAYREVVEQGVWRERGNIRSFWYERFMYVLRTVMRDKASQNSLDVTINQAWGELVEEGWVTYDVLNLYSEKEDAYTVAAQLDSPYPTAIVLVEKAAFFDDLHDLANVYEISFCAAGGQSSRAAAMAYVKKLETLAIDTDQTFTVYSMMDCDPQGWDIPKQFCNHLRIAGVVNVELVRLGILKEQLGDTVSRVASVYPLGRRGSKEYKQKLSLAERWAEEAGGGIWLDGQPGRVELNIYRPSQLRELIVEGLCQHLDGFAYQVRGLTMAITRGETNAWKSAGAELRAEIDELYESYYEAISEKENQIDEEIAGRTEDEDRRIRELYRAIRNLEAVKKEKTEDLGRQKDALDCLHDRLREMESNAFSQARDNSTCETTASDLIRQMGNNDDWSQLADECGVGRLTKTDLVRFAERRAPVRWWPSREEQEAIDEWVARQLEITYGDPYAPAGSPEDWILLYLE